MYYQHFAIYSNFYIPDASKRHTETLKKFSLIQWERFCANSQKDMTGKDDGIPADGTGGSCDLNGEELNDRNELDDTQSLQIDEPENFLTSFLQSFDPEISNPQDLLPADSFSSSFQNSNVYHHPDRFHEDDTSDTSSHSDVTDENYEGDTELDCECAGCLQACNIPTIDVVLADDLVHESDVDENSDSALTAADNCISHVGVSLSRDGDDENDTSIVQSEQEDNPEAAVSAEYQRFVRRLARRAGRPANFVTQGAEFSG